jgi:nucleotide-binding universal stress UspA family protein
VTAVFRKILLPLDGSAHSTRTTEAAIEVAKRFDAAVVVLCVYRHHSALEASLSMFGQREGGPTPDDALRAHAREVAGAAKATLTEAGIGEVSAHAKRGQPARTIVDFAEANGCDLIVLGARGGGDAGGFLLGSVSHKGLGAGEGELHDREVRRGGARVPSTDSPTFLHDPPQADRAAPALTPQACLRDGGRDSRAHQGGRGPITMVR